MAPRRLRRKHPLITDINITPLVDVVLVLLVVLMVVSTYIVSQAMNVELAGADTRDIVTEDPLTLIILDNGQIRLDGQEIPETLVQNALVLAFSSTPDLPLVISAHEGVPYGRVVHFVDMARQSGGTRFAIKVEEGQ